MPSIYARQKNAEGQWRYIRVNIGRGRRPVDLTGPFYLRTSIAGKMQWLTAGDTLDDARIEAEKREAKVKAQASGLVVEDGAANRLRTKIAAYNAEIQANKARKTALAYANTLSYFTQSCKRTNVVDITREDLLAFKTFLRKEDDHGDRLSDRSVYNNFLNIMIFLKWCNVKPGVKPDDWPPCPEREPEEYRDEEINALLGAALSNVDPKELQSPRHQPSQTDERLLLNCFLCTGLRSGEIAHLTYGDIDFKHSVWTVQPKEGLEWRTKTEGSQRDVPAPEWLTKKIYKRMVEGQREKSDLIFPSREGKPDRKLLNVVKRVAKRAKITGRVDDHKFRSTAITRWLRDGVPPQDVMAWVGHESLDTILRYAAKINVRKTETVRKAANTFKQFASVGD
jgi:integrase/recombinase XerC